MSKGKEQKRKGDTQREKQTQREAERQRHTPRERPNLYIRNKSAFAMGSILQLYIKIFCLVHQNITVFGHKAYKVVAKVI